MTLTLPLRAARTPLDPGDTTGTGGAIAGDSLCRVEQTPHDGGDTALLAELAALIPPLGESSIVHGSTSLPDGAAPAISITLGEVGAPVGPGEVVVQLGSGGVAILGQSPSVTRPWWSGTAEEPADLSPCAAPAPATRRPPPPAARPAPRRCPARR